MSTPPRFYSSTALVTNLTGSITPSDTTINVASTDGFPASTPYTLALDYGAANEELVDVTGVAGLSLTVTRAVDFTSASSHNTGAIVRHVSSARDFREAKAHEIAVTDVHGVTAVDGDFVSTNKAQTLSNKTLNKATGTLKNVDIFNVGTWRTAVIGDSTNPTAGRLAILDNEVSLNPLAEFVGSGALYVYNQTGDAGNLYKIRLTNNAGTADRFYVCTDGRVASRPDPASTAPAYTAYFSSQTSNKTAFRVTDLNGTNDTAWITAAGNAILWCAQGSTDVLTVRHKTANPTGFYVSVQDSGGNSVWAVNNAAKMVANRTADITATTSGAAPILRVLANTTLQTADLQQWLNQSGAVASRIDSTGNFVSGNFKSNLESVGSVVTAASGWSIAAFNTIRRGGWIIIGATVERTGGAITVGSGGNVSPDSTIGTISVGNRPTTLMAGRLLQYTMTNGVGSGTVQVDSDSGTINLLDWSTGGTIPNNDLYRFTIIYPID